jgi:histidyl-tRNA synthetase
MNDILPTQTPYWRWLEDHFRDLMQGYGYHEIRLPLVELTELFKRSIGEVTDIVEKEMYTFLDRNNDSLTLRPEGTAGCVRAAIENGLLYNQTQKLWYAGAMFRHERPQKGRYRQFHQLGVEVFGLPGPDADIELILLTARLWKRLGLSADVRLEINTLGASEARAAYRQELVAYLAANTQALDEDSRRRMHSNPLRVLDSKNPAMQDLINAAPKLLDHMDAESKQHFTQLCDQLQRNEVPYAINPRLVRGLDYYNRTVFEWVTDKLGAQGTVCAGGRYDGLVAQLGGGAVPAVGFALGMERVVAMLEEKPFAAVTQPSHAYLIMVGESAQQQGLILAEKLRDALPRLALQNNLGGGGFKNQMKRADKSGAKWALILADDECQQHAVAIKFLREDQPQQTISQSALVSWLQEHINQN